MTQQEQHDLDELLLAAVDDGDLDSMRSLLAAGAPIETDRTGNGLTPLFRAATGGRTDILLELLAKGAAIEAKGVDGSTALHQVVANGYWDGARTLIDAGADVVATNKDGLAHANGHGEIVAMIDAHTRMQKLLNAAPLTNQTRAVLPAPCRKGL